MSYLCLACTSVNYASIGNGILSQLQSKVSLNSNDSRRAQVVALDFLPLLNASLVASSPSSMLSPNPSVNTSIEKGVEQSSKIESIRVV